MPKIITNTSNLSNGFVFRDIDNNRRDVCSNPAAQATQQNPVPQEPHSQLAEFNSRATEDLKANLNKKLFAHIHADHAIRGTSLEGANPLKNAKYLADCLDLIDISIEVKGILKTAFNSLISCRDASIAAKVKNLTCGNSLLMSGGYQDQSGGHVVLYEFYKKANNHYDIYLYNTGEGIGLYHPQIHKEGILFYKAVIKFEDVLPEELDLINQNDSERSLFFQYLADLNCAATNDEKSIETLYKKGFGHLTKKLVIVKGDQSLFIKGQYSGTCSWRVLQAFALKTFRGFSSYKKYVFELKLVTLALFFKKCEEGCDLESYMLLEEATTNLLRAVAKLYHADSPDTTILSKEKAACAHVTLQEIQKKLPALKAHVRVLPPEQEPIKKKQDSFKVHSSDVQLKPSSIQSSPSLLVFSTMDAADFLRQINQTMNHIDALPNKESKSIQIENFVNALPVSPTDSTKDFWQKIPQEDLVEGLSSIQKMIELYGDLCLNNPPFFPNQQNTALSLLELAHRFAIRIDQQQAGKLENYGIWNAFLSYADQQRFFICFEPHEQQRREELYAYFTSIGKDKQQLFRFPLLKGRFKETTHDQLAELFLFKHAIDQDPTLGNALTEQARQLLGKEQESSNFTGSLEMVKKIILITDSTCLRESDKTQHLAILRNISYIVQQFAGYIQKTDSWMLTAIPRKYRCTAKDWQQDQITYRQSFNWESNSDPAVEYHLLPAKEEVKNLVKSLDSFSQLLSVVTKQTEPKLQLQPENTSLQYQKQLETTQCEPHLQPQKLIYYFQEHLEELTDLNKQSLFDLLFFKQVDREVSLFQELQSNPFFVLQCKQFIIEGLDRFSQSRSEESRSFFAYLFFVRLIYRLNQIQQDLQMPNLNLPDIQKSLNSWLESPHLDPEDKACLHLHRMMQHAYLPNDKISSCQLQEIIPSWFYYRRSHLLAKKMPYLENQATAFMHRIGPCMEKLLREEQQTVICQVLQVLGIANISQETIREVCIKFPFYSITLNDENFWKLDLLTAQIENTNGLIEGASTKELQKMRSYQDLFKDKIFDIYKSDGYYRFFCPEKGQIRIHKQRYEDDCVIESHIDNSWYQYVPEARLKNTKIPSVLVGDHWHWHSKQQNEMLIISKEHNQIIAKVRTIKGQARWNQDGFNLGKIESVQQEQ
ncbi:MAG: hypothetical protein AABZ92_02940, partial [Verrucomicrobiota bacterium]